MYILALALATSAAQPLPLRSFADWTMGCDNGHACTAMALIPDDYPGQWEEYLQLTLERGAAPGAPIRISWDNDARDLPGTVALLVDGRVIAPRVTQNMALTLAMVDALRNGRSAALRAPGGRPVAASLSGIAASLLAMDAVQGRVGTATAAARRGTAPMRAPIPALPVIVRPALPSAAPRTITLGQARTIIGEDYAVCDGGSPPVTRDAHRIDATHSLVLIQHPCGNGAYNYFATAMIVDEAGLATPAAFSSNPGMGEEETGNMLVNAGYDAATRTLSSYVKGRGLGDCNTVSDYVWDGRQFALTAQFRMDECRGRLNNVQVWRAIVR